MSLEIFCTIKGIGAASGIIYDDGSMYLVSDASTLLYRYDIKQQQLHRILLNESGDEQMLKKDKPDFEILTRVGNDLFLIGSGSTPKRNLQVIYNLISKEFKNHNLSELYQRFKAAASLTDDELNLEGAFYHEGKWYYFQRGNGRKGTNGIFIANQDDIVFHPIALTTIKHVETTFTDAVLVDDAIYFLAVAEDSQSTYDDGEVLGSIVGSLDIETLKINFTRKISDSKKFEGIALYQNTEKNIEFLLCEDDDSESTESIIYKISLDKNHSK